MLKGFTHARLACGCRITFREGVEGSPVTVVVDEKSPACTLPLHVRDLPLFDYREALRPPTRLLTPSNERFQKDGSPPGKSDGRGVPRSFCALPLQNAARLDISAASRRHTRAARTL